jgi:Fe-S cluster biogenesis protein NfuA
MTNRTIASHVGVTAPDELAAQVAGVLDRDVRPFLQSHGGDAEVVRIDDGVVEVRMFAACGMCELKPVTFASRIRATLLNIADVRDVVCGSVPLSGQRLDNIAEFFA